MEGDHTTIFAQGGQPLVRFLELCVLSIETDPLFLFLAREYRTQPTRQRAIALYDLFLAAEAPARVSTAETRPPRNLTLLQAVETIRRQAAAGGASEAATVPMTAPARYLFDGVAAQLADSAGGAIAALVERFDPELAAAENLEGGRMTPAQQRWVKEVWQAIVRPRLVAAGFWRVANLG